MRGAVGLAGLAAVVVAVLLFAAGEEGSGSERTRACPIRRVAGAPRGFEDVTRRMGLLAPLRGMYAHAVAWGDVNGDRYPDLFVGGFADYPLAEYRRRGAGGPAPDRLLLGGPRRFRQAPGFPRMLGRTSGATFADLDRDGDEDLVIARDVYRGRARGTAPGEVLAGDGRGGFREAFSLPAGLRARTVAVLDFDRDGRLDLFVTDDHYRGGESRLLRNRGGLRFADVTARAGLSSIQGFGAAAADLNGDGVEDLVVAGTRPRYHPARSRAARLFLGRRNGTFAEAHDAAFAVTTHDISDDMTGVAVGDVNGDGRPDIALGPHFESTEQYCVPASVRLYLNRGGARFRERKGLPATAAKSADVEIEDMDNDGRPDLFTTAPAGNGPAVLRGPAFAAPPEFGRGGRWTTAATADFDRDGRQDVFLASFDPRVPSRLLRNVGPAGGSVEIRAPIGSRVEVYRAGRLGDRKALVGDREVVAETGYGSGVRSVARFGVGRLTRVDVRIRRPRGGQVEDRRGVSVRFPPHA